ncbi:3-isopropylmalate dehydrogenase [Thiohalorhabdus denitrificans]|uniref:3-isopropylmalate dehydrogenase n=1 Tax=Thiohalorhabdus denitrificans TaxID=381306 RepID=A0A0P9CUT4_9GAMM|nr:3-isopropylmalate dehydrogenase [Thiohalorhabdus denitrificans]KPV40432.1 3-isopropylmalate dehydrogenase [Thiohalorhabdus denitrificans]SCY60629.1 3-isopropylmalate dehydrogenase [Thiohalorhabdus denitrificans]
MTHKLAVLPGDGIGPDIVREACKVLEVLRADFGLDVAWEEAPVGGTAYDQTGHPLPDTTLELAKSADAVLLGAVGGPQWDNLDYTLRPERVALLGLRKELDLFANLRPAKVFPELVDASALRPEVAEGIDIMVVRELTSGIYFGEPRGVEELPDGRRKGLNSLVYTSDEIERIARVAFEIARKRSGRVCSVDKANVLEVSQLWRDVVSHVGQREFPDVELSHMYVDNAAMQLVRDPKQFDVMVTTNMFGDILSDEASMLTGSIGLLPSASLSAEGAGMYEPIHGSAPDIAGIGKANPLATILSTAMMLRYSLDEIELADRIERAVGQVLADGLRTPDIAGEGERAIGTAEMGDAVVAALRG